MRAKMTGPSSLGTQAGRFSNNGYFPAPINKAAWLRMFFITTTSLPGIDRAERF